MNNGMEIAVQYIGVAWSDWGGGTSRNSFSVVLWIVGIPVLLSYLRLTVSCVVFSASLLERCQNLGLRPNPGWSEIAYTREKLTKRRITWDSHFQGYSNIDKSICSTRNFGGYISRFRRLPKKGIFTRSCWRCDIASAYDRNPSATHSAIDTTFLYR